jgi:hypothetical protein
VSYTEEEKTQKDKEGLMKIEVDTGGAWPEPRNFWSHKKLKVSSKEILYRLPKEHGLPGGSHFRVLASRI